MQTLEEIYEELEEVKKEIDERCKMLDILMEHGKVVVKWKENGKNT